MTADATLPASDDLTPEVLARWEEREKTALRRVWTAMGCAPNPDDFKPAVRDQMWDMVVDNAEKDAAKNNRLYRENAELLSGVRSRDARIAELEAVIEAAPHAGSCGLNETDHSNQPIGIPCTCWKSRYRAGADHE